MEEVSVAPIASLLRTDGAPTSVPATVTFSMRSAAISIGRAETNNVVLNDRKISKVHARLSLRTCKRKGMADGEIMKRLFIKDSSTFGSFVNGKALQKEQWVMLAEGDVIGLRNPHGNASLGEYRVQYHDGDGAQATALAEEAPPAQQAATQPQMQQVAPSAAAAQPPPQAARTAPGAAQPPTLQVDGVAQPVGSAPPQPVVAKAPRVLPLPRSTEARPGDAQEPPRIELGSMLEGPPETGPPAAGQGVAAASTPAQASRGPLRSLDEFASPASPASRASEVSPAPDRVQNLAPAPAEPEPPAPAPPLEMYAEPLSPLSEVSEVSAPDEEPGPVLGAPVAAPGGTAPGATAQTAPQPGLQPGLLPGMLPGLPTLPGLPGRPPFGLPLLPGMPPLGLPPFGVVPPLVGAVPDASGLPGLGTIVRPPPPGGVPKAPTQLPGALGTRPAAPPAPAAPPPVVMTVQQELVGMLIGKGGETVKQLSKDSGARIEISKTGTDGPSGERTVYLSGSTECIDRAKQMIEDTLNKARERTGVNNPNAFVMKVPHELVGMLIGKGGETIKELKKESGARIDISKEPTDTTSNDRLVHISGPPECVEFAKKMVEEMLGRARERHGLRRSDDPDGDRDRDRDRDRERERERSPDRRPTQTTIQVPHELIGMLIGKGGETIKGISKDSGARIEIAKDEQAEKEERRAVYLCGPPDALEKAKAMIEETLSRSRERQLEDRDPRRDHDRGGAGPKVIHVAPELVGMLIGKGGETIKQVSRDTGARIEISKDDRDNCDRTVTISGSPDAIERARDAIDDVLDRARERLEGRSERRSDRRDRGQLALPGPDDDEDSALMPYGSKDRKPSPIKDSYLNEKVYVDEVEMPNRPCFLPEHEDGLPTDLEVFIRGLPKICTERDLWEHLYRLGATDVKEILLLRRQKQSKGMAYVVFNRHDHAMLAKAKLNNAPAASVPCAGQMPTEEKGTIMVRFSESERCINGRGNVYGTDMVGLLLGSKGKCMQLVKDESGLRKVLLTGRSMKSYGQVDEDPRLHMVVYYEPDEADNVTKAIEVWGEQLGKIHKEIVEKMDRGKGAKGYGRGKGWPEYFEWGPPPDFPRPPFMDGPHAMRPPPPPEFVAVEAPVLLQRRRLAPPPGEDASEAEQKKLELTGPKILEATCLRGRELRWQPWPEVTKFNEEWKALPMRWGLRGELFVLLRRRDSGEARVCAAEVHLPLEKWPVLNAVPAASPAAARTRYKSFTFNEHLFLLSIDRESGTLKVFHVPDPSSTWDVAFETTLPMELGEDTEGLEISRSAKFCVFYSQDRVPHVLTVEPKAAGEASAARLFRIVDPGKAWTKLPHPPQLSPKVRLLPVYTKTKSGSIGDFEVSVFSVDQATNEIAIHYVPKDTEKPWILVSKLPFAGDTRLSCIYVPGKPEPLLMAGSPTERMQKLCHLNLIEWCAAKLDERMTPPKAPVVEEKFSRQMASLWPEGGREGAGSVAALPVDCTADLPVSRHLWVTMPIAHGGDLVPVAARPPDMRPPFEYPFGHPPFDPRGPPPHFDMRPPPYGRPPYDDHRPPFEPPMGGKGFDPHRPPFDRPPFDRPPPGWYDGHRPPFEPPPFGDRRPPYDGPPPGGPPPHFGERPPFDDRRPPFDGPPPPGGGRPPFEAPPGDWFGGGGPRPPFDGARDPRDMERRPPMPPGPLEVGCWVEANFRERGQFLRAKVLAKHEDGTFDLEYDGDYIEWHVPTSRIRPMPPFMPPPWGPHPPGAPGAPDAPEGERRHRRHHHRHRREHGAEGAEGAEGGERKRHRHHHHRHHGEAGEATAEAGEAGEAGGERKRRRRHHHRHGERREEGEPPPREASASADGEAAAAAPAGPPPEHRLGPAEPDAAELDAAEPAAGSAAPAGSEPAGPAAEAGADAGGGGEGSPAPRKRHRHHHRHKDPDRHKDPEKKEERSRSQDGERRKHRKRRHRSGDRDRGGGGGDAPRPEGQETAREAGEAGREAEASDEAPGDS